MLAGTMHDPDEPRHSDAPTTTAGANSLDQTLDSVH
jgi:hypothetical protein